MQQDFLNIYHQEMTSSLARDFQTNFIKLQFLKQLRICTLQHAGIIRDNTLIRASNFHAHDFFLKKPSHKGKNISMFLSDAHFFDFQFIQVL